MSITARPWYVTIGEGIAGPSPRPPIMYAGEVPHEAKDWKLGGITYVADHVAPKVFLIPEPNGSCRRATREEQDAAIAAAATAK